MGVGESGGVGGEVGKEKAVIEKGEVGIGKEEIEGKVEMNIEDVQVFFWRSSIQSWRTAVVM